MHSQPLTFMLTRPLTIVLNTNQTKRTTILLDSDSDSDLKQTILRESRSKFRQNKLSRVFLHGGLELQDGRTIPSSVKEVFVSNGEEYTPPPAEVRIIGNGSAIHNKAIDQLKCVSKLPGVRMVVGLPDLHPGTRFPIGCAIAADDVYPALIGSDIGCGAAVYALTPPLSSRPSASQLADLLHGLDDPWDGDVRDWLESHGIRRHSPFDKSSLGTIGGGNHFAEICHGESIINRARANDIGIMKGALYLIVHTGSRGLGAAVQAAQTVDDSNPCLPTYSALLHSYMEEHDYAVRWAVANRDLIAHRIMMCLFDNTDDPIELKKIIDVTHNSVTKALLKLGSDDEATDVWIHRKGAVPTDEGFVPCLGSRGDYTWILAPLGDGNYNIRSLAHGAGRQRPRQDLHTFAPPNESLTTTAFGSEVVCTDRGLLLEERPEAYKPIHKVVLDMEDTGICRGIATLIPVVSYKVREGGQRRI